VAPGFRPALTGHLRVRLLEILRNQILDDDNIMPARVDAHMLKVDPHLAPATQPAERAAGFVRRHQAADYLAVSGRAGGGLHGAHQFPSHAVPPVVALDIDQHFDNALDMGTDMVRAESRPTEDLSRKFRHEQRKAIAMFPHPTFAIFRADQKILEGRQAILRGLMIDVSDRGAIPYLGPANVQLRPGN